MAGGTLAPVAAGAAPGGAWTVYHGDPLGTGTAAGIAAVSTATRAWTSPPLDGQLYGEPLVSGADVYVATENDTVYALSGATGAVVWSRHVGPAVPSSDLPCGNISPTVGITGTPVIDAGRGEIFVVADELVGGRPAHELVGLSTASGAVETITPVDPPGSDPAAALQRTGLTLDAGAVIFGMGGNYGDCGTYRGRLVRVPESGGPAGWFTVDAAAGQREGAVWMGGGAPIIDGAGHIWVTAGNGSVESPGQPYDHSDSVLELSPTLSLLQYFAPSDWAAENSRDLDLSTAPALLGSQVLAAGKDDRAYLLDASHLGGIGGQTATLDVPCPDDIDGGTAVSGNVVYLPCLGGPVAVRVSAAAPSLGLVWRSSSGGGPPILAGGLVWSLGSNGTLYGLDPATGALRQQAAVGSPANHFATPAAGDDLLLATSATRVVAFRAQPAPTPASTVSPGSTTAATGGGSITWSGPAANSSGRAAGPARSGRPGGFPVVAVVAPAGAGGAAAGAAAVWWLVRRRRSPSG